MDSRCGIYYLQQGKYAQYYVLVIMLTPVKHLFSIILNSSLVVIG